MANHPSALRQWRRSQRRFVINKRNKSILRGQIRKLREAIKNGDKQEARRLLSSAFSVIDKAVKKGTIHENKGNRYKSRLSQQLELLKVAPSQ